MRDHRYRGLSMPDTLCDWGKCLEPAVIDRWSRTNNSWLPCCAKHAPGHELVLQYPEELLQQIAAGVNKFDRVPSVCIEVAFVVQTDEGEEEYVFGLASALDALANGLTWDERGNWSMARIARVRTI